MTEIETLDRAFRALGDATRLHIVRFLGCCPESVGSALDAPTAGAVCCAVTGERVINATVSHHLKELRDAGLVSVVRDGRARRYSLRADTLHSLHQALGQLIDQVEGKTQ